MEAFDVAVPEQHESRRRSQRVFTFEQANRTLPLVSRVVRDVVGQHKKVCILEERCQLPNPGTSDAEIEKFRDEYADELEHLRVLRDELAAIGCQLKDWRRGIVDFLSLREGRLIELCWRLGEEKIQHWHGTDTGFCGRQLIDEEFLNSIDRSTAEC